MYLSSRFCRRSGLVHYNIEKSAAQAGFLGERLCPGNFILLVWGVLVSRMETVPNPLRAEHSLFGPAGQSSWGVLVLFPARKPLLFGLPLNPPDSASDIPPAAKLSLRSSDNASVGMKPFWTA